MSDGEALLRTSGRGRSPAPLFIASMAIAGLETGILSEKVGIDREGGTTPAVRLWRQGLIRSD